MKVNNINGGLTGKILRIDLTTRKISTEGTEKYAGRFIGGRPINSFILLNEMKPETRWSDPENILIFGAGCLVGTLAPAACRVSVDTKNAFNNGKGSANFGGHFGPELKYAGFDHVVITGKAEKPVYLWIHDGEVEIRNGSFIWGKKTAETEEILRRELGDNRVKVASIGPAGENLVRGSTIIADCGKVAGGSGVGCVMGSKKIKALAVRGHGAIRVAQPERFINIANLAFKKINASSFSQPWRKGIIQSAFSPESKSADMADLIRNGQDEYWPIERRIKLTGKNVGVPKYIQKILAGFSCPIGCLPFLEINEGKYKGTRGMTYWANSKGYSQRFDVDDAAASVKFQLLANDLGLDGDMASAVIPWAFECYEKGLISSKDTDGLKLEWGNEDAMVKLEQKLAYREGFGDFLADGVKEASRKLGKGSEEFAIHVKGQDSYDNYRIQKGWGLGISTSPVAGRHLRGAISSPEITGPKGLNWSPIEYEKQPEIVFWQIRAEEIENITGTCLFVGSFLGAHALEPKDYVDLVSAALGIELTEEEFMYIGRRSYNLEKAFNTIHTNFDRKDDYPPKRYIEEPIKSGPYAGYKCDKEKWDEMLDRFYELHGWDITTGLQTRDCLMELGLEDIVEKLEKAGKLID